MTELALCFSEPFSSPAWGSNFVVFAGEPGTEVPEAAAKDYLGRAVKYAAHHGVYLVPERFLLSGYRCMCLISPLGGILGAQKALYLSRTEASGKRSTRIEILQTEFGSIFLCVDADAFHPEVCRFAAGMGAEIIICSQYFTKAEYGSHLVVTGCWNAAQLNRAYVVAASNQFHCVCAPAPVSAHGDGFVLAPNTKLPLTARIHAEKLLSVKARPNLSRKFYAIHRTELLR